jgi:PAS domain S-box-containing protein
VPPDDLSFGDFARSAEDDALYLLDAQGKVLTWNPGAERITGYRAEEIVGRSAAALFPAEEVEAGRPEAELIAAAEGRYTGNGWRVRKDGSRFLAGVTVTAIRDERGALRAYGHIVRDLGARLPERSFAGLAVVEETERRRIAGQVHDDPVQAIVAAGMRLQLLAGKAPDDLRPGLGLVGDQLQETTRRLRQLVAWLRPTALDSGDLVGSIESYLADVVTGWGIAYTFRHELVYEPPEEVVLTVFRIVQEALANVHDHAHATTVVLSLEEESGGLLTRVSDDGIGIAERDSTVPGRERFGLLLMRERAEAASGWFSVHSESGAGVSVEFWIPVTHAGEVPPNRPLGEAAPGA